MKILFSIPVHEQSECVDDLLDNILKFVCEPVVILHISSGFNYQVKDRHKRIVHVNECRIKSGFMDGSLTYIHFSNLKYSLKLRVNADVFMPFASNQLFVKSGIEKYISNYKQAKSNVHAKVTDKRHYPVYIRDKFWFERIGIDVRKSAPEGTYYSYQFSSSRVQELASCNYFDGLRKYIYTSTIGFYLRKIFYNLYRLAKVSRLINILPTFIAHYSYASEEIILPSILNENGTEGEITCFLNWDNDLNVTIDDVNKIVGQCNSIYSVKRVDRDIEDNIRKYIGELSSCLEMNMPKK